MRSIESISQTLEKLYVSNLALHGKTSRSNAARILRKSASNP
ncbi:hypothetical protein APHNP_0269 [Anaplasma phagocytophilum str. ApNP]|uniref:Uncharacterized protein n=2 Tax=Anaplasma phagocytophilum TaxID=948 RepID=A0A0F3NIV6_ANAPH|nr:hypothetical protein APHMUC_0484 [Anaplasma phagocytophilum str. ApMUC09]KJV67696.1 hypothetical protein APHNP_0269 [Anaplasma phagocytophilum str. ApNP]